MRTLPSRRRNTRARRELEHLGASCIDPLPVRFLRRWGLAVGKGIGDPLKSWDVLETLLFLRDRLPLDAPILDTGAFASEILHSLRRLGFSNLTGVDLNPALLSTAGEGIRPVVADFMATPFPDRSFNAITAISVIEHGFQPERLLREVSRLLVPEGWFVASFDYWPDKIDTSGIRIFDMSWSILSREEIQHFVEQASGHSLEPCGALELDATDSPIEWSGRRYTFGWLALQKR